MYRCVFYVLLTSFLLHFAQFEVDSTSFGSLFDFNKKGNNDPGRLQQNFAQVINDFTGQFRRGAEQIKKKLRLSKREAPSIASNELPPESNQDPSFSNVPATKPLINPNETEAERAQRIHRTFEKLLTFVEIVGQVDNYFSSKWKNLVRTVSDLYNSDEDDGKFVSSRRRRKSCRGCD